MKLNRDLEDAQLPYKTLTPIEAATSSHRYNARTCMDGTKFWLNEVLFEYYNSKPQVSNKIRAKTFGPFFITKFIANIAVKL